MAINLGSKRAMAGPGSKKMGGAGIKAGRPPTPMAGSGLGAPPRSPAAAMGAPLMAPKVANVRPPGLGAGAPPPMPGGAPPGGGVPPPPPGGMGGSGGFAKGGGAKRFADGGDVSKIPPAPPPGAAGDVLTSKGSGVGGGADTNKGPIPDWVKGAEPVMAHKKGGSVGIRMGGDTKSRHKGTVHKGR